MCKMSSWKRIVSMAGLSMSAALLGVACTAEVADSTPSLDLPAPAEVTEDAESALTLLPPDRDERDFPWRRDGSCGQQCFDAYWRCLRFVHGNFLTPRLSSHLVRQCNREYSRCTSDCYGLYRR
jgi:hypothetical protein